MKALVLVAHGSRKDSSNKEVALLSEKMNSLIDKEFDIVKHGFLELAEPSIPGAINHCCDLGATEVTVVPYFLSAGRHVTEDIPEEVEKAKIQNPEVEMIISQYLGARSEIADLLIKAALFVQGGRGPAL